MCPLHFELEGQKYFLICYENVCTYKYSVAVTYVLDRKISETAARSWLVLLCDCMM